MRVRVLVGYFQEEAKYLNPNFSTVKFSKSKFEGGGGEGREDVDFMFDIKFQ